MTGIMRNTSFAAQRGINLCKGFLERDGWSDTYGLGFFEEPDLSKRVKEPFRIPVDSTVILNRIDVETYIKAIKEGLNNLGFKNYICRCERYTKYKYYSKKKESFWSGYYYIIEAEYDQSGFAIYIELQW